VTPNACELALRIGEAFLHRQEEGIPVQEVVVWGRSPARTWHAELHACYADGRYVLVDMIGPMNGTPSASDRSNLAFELLW